MAIADGEDCTGPLGDTLEEEGLVESAKWIRAYPMVGTLGRITGSSITGLVLRDDYNYEIVTSLKPVLAEIQTYLEKRGSNVSEGSRA